MDKAHGRHLIGINIIGFENAAPKEHRTRHLEGVFLHLGGTG